MHLNDIAARIEKLSAQYAEVYGIERSAEWALLKLTEEVGELTQAHLTATGQSKDRGRSKAEHRQELAAELGDVIGMCLVYVRTPAGHRCRERCHGEVVPAREGLIRLGTALPPCRE